MQLESKSLIIESVCTHIHQLRPIENGLLDLFSHHFFQRAPIEFLQKLSITELSCIVLDAWFLLQKRQLNQSFVKVNEYELSHYTKPRLGICMVNIDQSFLIDSIKAFLTKENIIPEVILHPVLGIERSQDGNLLSLIDLEDPNLKNNQFPITAPQPDSTNYVPESIIFIQFKNTLEASEIQKLQNNLDHLLIQIRQVVSDWHAIQEQIKQITTQTTQNQSIPSPYPHDVRDLLNWLVQGNFVFLGSRTFSIKSSADGQVINIKPDSKSPNLGLFQEKDFLSNEDLKPNFGRICPIPPSKEADLPKIPTLSITKTNTRSTVHRSSRIDSIEIIDWDKDGNPKVLHQFIGIFTRLAYTGSAFDTPIIGRKVNKVFTKFGFAPQWYDGKLLISILNSIPRDELFYLSEKQIYEISQSVLNMNDRHALSILLRPDTYNRYIATLIFLPREKYSFELKERFEGIIEHYLKGKITSSTVLLSELDFARLIFVTSYDETAPLISDQKAFKKALLEATLSWEDHLERAIGTYYDEDRSTVLFSRYQGAFPAAYIEQFTPEQALSDIEYLERIHDHYPVELCLYQLGEQTPLKIKIFHALNPLSLSTLLPILQNLGFTVIGETSYIVEKDGYPIHIHDFDIYSQTDSHGLENWQKNEGNLIAAFHHIWLETAENDILNQLILKAGLTIRQVTIMRAYIKFLWQVQMPYSLGYVEETLSDYPNITRNFVEFFERRFALPAETTSKISKRSEETALLKQTNLLLLNVDRLDHDRILRRVLNAIQATVRTNYYQVVPNGGPHTYLSLKFDCHQLESLPSPSPLCEIFIYSPRVEAVHLRGGKVSRGGIRWSERPEDFRTEVLGLMKAQTVKNAVIVPLGSKGGFIVKNQARFVDRSLLQEEVIQCYKIMMNGMLDITDNLVGGKIVHPENVLCYDEDDPYLVVAADKGTAAFSDIANTISLNHNFWLGDAFASGGSDGYDHKKIAITARGAWEAVKRHFRELKVDIQNIPFTVVGVGDMSGDVFGNGMLQSKKISLIAAFNHQHIFIDPTPDLETSYAERKRLFDLPTSSWKDYNTTLISAGGGIFDRFQKTIKLSPQICKLLDINQEEITPDALIKTILCLPVELLYFGGIGTFIKASTESHADVGDRTNNEIRVDGKTIRAKVIGEGANLGMTQLGRVEYALHGGLLNTDAIDNSAGVDCSDHEVNIKILFNTISDQISYEERNQLLREMTDDIALSVLEDNYRQTQILSVLSAAGSAGISSYQSLIRTLEAENGLNRSLEYLPDDEDLERRRARDQGLTRPELSVLLGFSKIALYEKILASHLPDEDCYQPLLHGYFPELIQERFGAAIDAHPLRREITATILANTLINRVGPTFIYEVAQTAATMPIDIIEAFFFASDILNLKNLHHLIDSLDYLMIAEAQTTAILDINKALEPIILWLLRHPNLKRDQFADLHTLLEQLPLLLHGDQKHVLEIRVNDYKLMGVPEVIAKKLALISFYPYILDIMVLSAKQKEHVTDHVKTYTVIAQTYFTLRSKIGLDWLMKQAEEIYVETDWQRSARISLIDDLVQIQAKLTTNVIRDNKSGNVDDWMQHHGESLHRVRPILANIKSAGRPDLGMLGYAVRQLQHLSTP